jgi:hypothetical protein
MHRDPGFFASHAFTLGACGWRSRLRPPSAGCVGGLCAFLRSRVNSVWRWLSKQASATPGHLECASNVVVPGMRDSGRPDRSGMTGAVLSRALVFRLLIHTQHDDPRTQLRADARC